MLAAAHFLQTKAEPKLVSQACLLFECQLTLLSITSLGIFVPRRNRRLTCKSEISRRDPREASRIKNLNSQNNKELLGIRRRPHPPILIQANQIQRYLR